MIISFDICALLIFFVKYAFSYKYPSEESTATNNEINLAENNNNNNKNYWSLIRVAIWENRFNHS